MCNPLQLHFHLTKQLWSISTTLPPPHLPTNIRRAVKSHSKWSLTLLCGKNVTSQWQFGGQHRVLHDIGGLENGVLLWTRVVMIKKRQTIRDILLEWLVPLAREPLFYNKAHRITNVRFDRRVNQAGVGQQGAHMTMAHSCCMLHPAHWIDCAWPIQKSECFPWIVQTTEQNFLYFAVFYRQQFLWEDFILPTVVQEYFWACIQS